MLTTNRNDSYEVHRVIAKLSVATHIQTISSENFSESHTNLPPDENKLSICNLD